MKHDAPPSPVQSPLGSDTERRRLWGIAGTVAVISIVGIGVLDGESVRRAVEVWEGSRTYNHGFLVLPIALYLLWERRQYVAQMVPQPSLAAGFLVLPLAMIWLVGRMISYVEAQQFALVAMMQVVLLAVLGWRVYLRLVFPFAYLFFLVPSGDYLVSPLQDFTAAFAVSGLKLVGVPVFSDGIIIEVPAGTFVVAEACAGLRFLIASVAYGVLFAGLVYRSWTRRLAFVAASFIVPIIANGLRAFGLVYAAQLIDNQAAVDADHLIYGWGFFAAVTLLLTVVGLRFRETETVPPAWRSTGTTSPGLLVAAGAICVALSAIAPAYATWQDREAERLPKVSIANPEIPGWQMLPAVESRKPRYVGASAEVFSGFKDGEKSVELYVGYYPRQTQGRKVIGSINRIADVEEWRRTASGTRVVSVGGEKVTVAFQRLASGRINRTIWYWYWINDRYVAGGVAAKIEQLKAEFLGGRRAAAVIALSSEYEGQPEDANVALQALADQLIELRTLLRNADPGSRQ